MPIISKRGEYPVKSEMELLMVMAAAKKISQVAVHMTVAFAIMFAMTGSIVMGGLALLIEPLINVTLLPYHERFWARVHAHSRRALLIAAEKLSQTGLHMSVAFAVMYGSTGSLAFGGVAAILEPVLNVALLPLHDRLWDRCQQASNEHGPWVSV
jgi:uncharacterized membrane protein